MDIFHLGQVKWSHRFLFMVLSGCLGLDGEQQLQLNPGAMEWLWIISMGLPTLVLDGEALPQTYPVHNLGVVLDSCHLLKDQVSLVVRRAFVWLHLVYQLHPFLDEEAFLSVIIILWLFLVWKLQSALQCHNHAWHKWGSAIAHVTLN